MRTRRTADPDAASAVRDLEAERDKITKRMQQRQEEYRRDQARLSDIAAELHRLSLVPLLGVEGGVMLRCRAPAGEKIACLNDRRGRLVALKQKWADVQFGEDHWTLSISELQPAGEPQGQMLLFKDAETTAKEGGK
jgi:hypothetical protein